MITSPVTLSRRHVLGEFHSRCLPIVNVPVYLDSLEGEMIGYADEGLGIYADAYRFHLSEELCKKLSSGHFTYSFDYDYVDKDDKTLQGKRRIKLNSILLNSRKGYARPVPKNKAVAGDDEVQAEAETPTA